MRKKSKTTFARSAVSVATVFTLLSISAQTQALVTYTDTDFPTATGINASTDDINVVTSSTVVTPQINMGSGYAVLTNAGHTVDINSAGIFSIKSNAAAGYNGFMGIFARSGTVLTHSDLEINMVQGRGIYIANMGTATFEKTVTPQVMAQS